MESQYIYLIHEREFIQSEKYIYKIGKTKQLNFKRFTQYPKDSAIIYHCTTKNCDIHEKLVIQCFKNKYIHRKDIGSEYFEGDHREMLCDIYDISSRLFKEQIESDQDSKRQKVEDENRQKIEDENRQKIEDENRQKLEDENRQKIEELMKIGDDNQFSCLGCNYFTSAKGSLKKHLNSKKHYITINPIEPVPTVFKCNNCEVYYKGQSGLWRHNKICKKRIIDAQKRRAVIIQKMQEDNLAII
jgi:hypothetical protein